MKQRIVDELVDQSVVVDDFTIHYMTNRQQAHAQGEPIILVHGLTVSYRYMCPLACELAASSCRVYVPDLPGFGKSTKPGRVLNLDELADTLAAWMTSLDIERAVFVGNSLGCQILARLALRHPERITHLVFTGPTMDRRARTAHQEITRWLINILAEPLSLYPIVIRDAFDLGLRRFVQTFRYGLQDDLTQHLPAIHLPTLVIRGSRDTIAPQRWVEEVTQLLPCAQLVVIPHAAHDLNYNSPRRLAHCIRVFVQASSH